MDAKIMFSSAKERIRQHKISIATMFSWPAWKFIERMGDMDFLIDVVRDHGNEAIGLFSDWGFLLAFPLGLFLLVRFERSPSPAEHEEASDPPSFLSSAAQFSKKALARELRRFAKEQSNFWADRQEPVWPMPSGDRDEWDRQRTRSQQWEKQILGQYDTRFAGSLVFFARELGRHGYGDEVKRWEYHTVRSSVHWLRELPAQMEAIALELDPELVIESG